LKEVEIFGLPQEIVRVDLHLDKMAEMNIPVQAVLGSIQSEIGNIPGGTIEAGKKHSMSKPPGTTKTLKKSQIPKSILFREKILR
jgi:multidrug efflux pump subunit AcrB